MKKGIDTISAAEADWTREAAVRGCYEPWKSLLWVIRRYQEGKQKGGLLARIQRPFLVLRYRCWSAICGADIPLNANIGGGLIMRHPNGIVIHPDAQVGPNCLIFQQVTIGAGTKPGQPTIGGHVDIGAGAKILGGVTIGDHVKIGANSVVISDIPHNCTVVGVPARIVGRE